MSSPPVPPSVPPSGSTGAIILTGGGSTRMGEHKPGLRVQGDPIVVREIEAVGDRPLVVVGHADHVPAGIPVVREDPPGGGPVAGIAAGLAALPAGLDTVLVLAGDLPLLGSALLEDLLGALAAAGPDGDRCVAVGSGPQGPNWLCAAWPVPLLAERLAAVGGPDGTPRDVSVRRLLAGVTLVEVADRDGASIDVDTPEDLAALRSRLGE